MPWLLKTTLIIALLMAPAQLYLIFRYYATAPQRTQKIFSGLLLSFCAYPIIALIHFYSTGSVELLEYPKLLTYWFWLGLIFVFQLATWVIPLDIIALGNRLFYGDKNVISRWRPKLLVALFITVFLFVATKTYLHTTQIEAEHITVQIDELPQSLEGFTIAHISDIQGDQYTGRDEISSYIQKVNAQNPDLIIFTGDLISYGTDFIEMSAEEFGKADAPFGTLALIGDHDYWAGLENIEPALEKQGIPLLHNQNHTIEIDSTTDISITGVTEIYSQKSDPQVIDSLTSSNSSSLKIFASHQVNKALIESAFNQNYSLMLAGHTHGGQIHVPFMGMGFSASQRETQYVQGLYHEHDLPINVNNGLGFTLAPIRYGAPPNISVITLEKE